MVWNVNVSECNNSIMDVLKQLDGTGKANGTAKMTVCPISTKKKTKIIDLPNAS